MPLLVHPVLRPLRMHRVSIQHTRLADGKFGNVYHLLDFAIAFRLDFSHFHGNEAAQRVFVFS